MAFRTWLYQHIRAVSEGHGYQEYEGPFLERVELYAAKSGDELVREQSFVFPDRGGEMVALRPELTPSLARMVATRSKAMQRPIRWWSFGPFWRYEKPQKGRTREFFQWNIDLLGVESPQADAELASIAATFFQSIGLPPATLRILVNSRKLIEAQLGQAGIPLDQHLAIFRLIDRKDRLSAQAWKAEGLELGLTPDQLRSLQGMMEDRQAWRQFEDLVIFFETIEAIGLSDYFEFDSTIVRGLDYYTGIVFEARDAAGKFRAILGGGRYDNLVADVGGDPIPGTGFAMGDVVLKLVLEKYDALPTLRTSPAQVMVTTFDHETVLDSLRYAQELRAAGLQAEWYPEVVRLSKQLRFADHQAIPIVAVLGPDEIQAGKVTIKDMHTGKQHTLKREQSFQHIAKLLSSADRT
jgi:histidyl-tRNA synthetase